MYSRHYGQLWDLMVNIRQRANNNFNEDNYEEDFLDNEFYSNTAIHETLLTSDSLGFNSLATASVIIAPAEGYTPISLLFEEKCEFLAFPTNRIPTKRVIHFTLVLNISPHAHMLLWLKDAPSFNIDSIESDQEICDFVDSIVTCSTDNLKDFPGQQRKKYEKILELVKQQLTDKDTMKMSYKILLHTLNIHHDEYLLAIRTSLSKPQLYLRRDPKDIYL
ncbi:ATP synthase gamma chain [Frankliniella fusca]|uniref:ATP synthase gamma chain n=1 Tax=Frankliniella fusca TaxID=407009 RepID=A0AAE1LDM8_9NEOP|nr:ATP synthase gamma chain [Frankliniella fusca]